MPLLVEKTVLSHISKLGGHENWWNSEFGE